MGALITVIPLELESQHGWSQVLTACTLQEAKQCLGELPSFSDNSAEKTSSNTMQIIS